MKKQHLNNLYNQVKENKISKKEAINNLKELRRISKEELPDVDDDLQQEENSSFDVLKKLKFTLVGIACSLVKIKNVEDFDKDAELNEYGFESIILSQLAKEINKEFKLDIMPTLFFECNTINSISEHILKEYGDICNEKYKIKEKEQELVTKKPGILDNSKKVKIDKPFKQKRKLSLGKVLSEELPPSEVKQSQNLNNEPIAIIGVSGRFPESDDLEMFWDNLKEGRDCISEIPKSRWDWEEYYGDPHIEGNKTNIKWGGFMNGLDEFDPLFFGISPREAELMDPQQRLLMTYIWKAVEDAGYSAKSLSGSQTGILVGTTASGYSNLVANSGLALQDYSTTGSVASVGPNRMSYFLNWHGPSEPIETACSSSLVAMHRAVTAIRTGQCTQVIAGGVNTVITPDAHISLGKSRMLSEDGRCKTFSSQADGYVRGEGVGMVMLKRLSDAERDGDHIYGLVLATAQNHGGRANSLTAPNPKAQAELLKTAYRQSGVDPSTIGYIEAHGSGTSLGDPIEIEGLKSSFSELYKENKCNEPKEPVCGLGSVKTNIGHLELAAGMAGVIKVLLQMRHKKLVKSLHSEDVNPYIRLEDSPFYIVQETQDWESIKDTEGKELPRRAGVSSFGFGGVNAHVVLEEYVPQTSKAAQLSEQKTPYMFVLSAKNALRLEAQVEQLIGFIDNDGVTNDNLRNAAYTFQVGREAMEERLGILADTVEELRTRLTTFLSGKQELGYVYRGHIKQDKDSVTFISEDDDLQEVVAGWAAKGKYDKLLELWVKGFPMDWSGLYESDERLQRMSLPTYPFSTERYWIEQAKKGVNSSQVQSGESKIHPLLHRNVSSFEAQGFTSSFTGEESFLKDHVVQGQLILPGVAYIEMVHAAILEAMGVSIENQIIAIKNVVWLRPFISNEASPTLQVSLYPEDNHNIEYEVYSEEIGSEAIVYSQGIVVLQEKTVFEELNLSSLQQHCKLGILSGLECYNTFEEIGFNYGSSHQCIEQLYQGDGQVLGKLSNPSLEDGYTLHPGMLDSALQASIGLMMGQGGEQQTALPFALESVQVYESCTSDMWVWVRYSQGSKAGDKIQKLDIDLCDDTGKIYVSLKGFTSRTVGEEITTSSSLALFTKGWEAIGVSIEELKEIAYVQKVIIGYEQSKATNAYLKSVLGDVNYMEKGSLLTSSAERFQNYASELLDKLQEVFNQDSSGQILVQVLVPAEGEGRLLSGLWGMLKTAQQEQPRLKVQLLEVGESELPESIHTKLEEASRRPEYSHIRYDKDTLLSPSWQALSISEEQVQPWQKEGVYLITGGAGGLGLLMAKEIIDQEKQTKIILTGRSLELSAEKQTLLDEWKSKGAAVEYLSVDISNQQSVEALMVNIENQYSGLNGIIHIAGSIRDNYIVHKTQEELNTVLPAKTLGVENLDQGSKHLGLDFFVCFSSIAGALGSAGQSDYAAANGYMDAFVTHRNEKLIQGKRQGQTVSINWPLWEDGGMQIGDAEKKMMWQSMGLKPLSTTIGMHAFYQILSAKKEQVMVLFGDEVKLKSKIQLFNSPKVLRKISRSVGNIDTGNITEKLGKELMQKVSKELKVNLSDIDLDEELTVYGFDSISFTNFSNILNNDYTLELTPTVFFEHSTLRSLSNYLSNNYSDVFASRFGSVKVTRQEMPPLTEPQLEREPKKSRKRSRGRTNRLLNQSQVVSKQSDQPNNDPIAIIGISGRFPESDDLEMFWDNLKEGRDCISEIPKSRWDWEEYYGDPHSEGNKTNIKWGGFMNGIDEFDPLFFNISPKEAELMDPQQRLLMIYVWKAVEDAGYSAKSLSGSQTGILVGTASSSYSNLIADSGVPLQGYSPTGSVASVGPNRMSYFLNWHGPSEPIETACSSSLVAMHRAADLIRSGQCTQAIAGGINTILTPEAHISFNKAGMLSEDGRCKTFSDQANGYVRGEGVGMVMLKRLSDAERDGDHIYGLVLGTAQNHGGRATSLTAPNPKAQAELLKTAYRQSGVDPSTIGYIEAHGTGTSLGDPIEIDGLKSAFAELYKEKECNEPKVPICGLGSVKTNIGHLELAAGMASVLKVLLQMRHKKLVKSLHCEDINPYIRLEDSPFYLVKETQDWEPIKDADGKELPRRAGVSSFGFGGVNAHVVLEEYVPRTSKVIKSPEQEGPYIFVLSAKNVLRLEAQVEQLVAFIDKNGVTNNNLRNVAYTLQVGREAMEERLGILADTAEGLRVKLSDFLSVKQGLVNVYSGNSKRDKDSVAFIAEDDELQKVIGSWAAKGKHDKLIELWVKGFPMDWSTLYNSDYCLQRIILPTYPFSTERFWVQNVNGNSEMDTQSVNNVKSDQLIEKTKSSTKEIILKHIEKVTGLELEAIDEDLDINELGIDSILLIKLINGILKEFPDLDSKEHGNAMLNSRTVAELYGYINDNSAVKSIPVEKNNECNIDRASSGHVFVFDDTGKNVRKTIISGLSQITSIPKSKISVRKPFDLLEVSFDHRSQFLKSISNGLLKHNLHFDDNALFNCKTIQELEVFIRAYFLSEGIDKENEVIDMDNSVETIDFLSLNDLHNKQKKNSKNLVCSNLKYGSDIPTIVEGDLLIDETHDFFFDHPLDHVSGMHLAEAINEVAKTAYLHHHELPFDSVLLISNTELDYISMCKKDVARIEIKIDKTSIDTDIWKIEACVFQEEKQMVKGKLTIQRTEKTEIDLSSDILSENIQKNFTRIDKKIVNKQNFENVLICNDTTIETDDCYLINENIGDFFKDFPNENIDSLVLMEAVRQFFRVHVSKQNVFDDEVNKDNNNISFLKSAKLTINRSINWKEPVHLIHGDYESSEVGSTIMINHNGSIVVNNLEIGSFEIMGISLCPHVYQEWEARLEIEESM